MFPSASNGSLFGNLVARKVMPNPSFEPTRKGWSLQAPISFWAFRAQPSLAAQLRRWAS